MTCLFFFQAEDGIRDGHVTGVQTCALPISRERLENLGPKALADHELLAILLRTGTKNKNVVNLAMDVLREVEDLHMFRHRSEERRVGKECRSRWWPDQEKKKDGGR